MTGGNGLYILPKFRTYQQTTEYTCGCAAVLMVLNYYGNCDYNEMDICRLAGTDPVRGTTVEGLVQFFDSLGWETVVHADTGLCFQTIDECEWRC